MQTESIVFCVAAVAGPGGRYGSGPGPVSTTAGGRSARPGAAGRGDHAGQDGGQKEDPGAGLRDGPGHHHVSEDKLGVDKYSISSKKRIEHRKLAEEIVLLRKDILLPLAIRKTRHSTNIESKKTVRPRDQPGEKKKFSSNIRTFLTVIVAIESREE